MVSSYQHVSNATICINQAIFKCEPPVAWNTFQTNKKCSKNVYKFCYPKFLYRYSHTPELLQVLRHVPGESCSLLPGPHLTQVPEHSQEKLCQSTELRVTLEQSRIDLCFHKVEVLAWFQFNQIISTLLKLPRNGVCLYLRWLEQKEVMGSCFVEPKNCSVMGSQGHGRWLYVRYSVVRDSADRSKNIESFLFFILL